MAMPENIPNPDPSLATNERLANAVGLIESHLGRNRDEARGWVDALQVLLEEKIRSAEDKTSNLDRVVQTRLAGSETALNAAMAASDKVVAKIETGGGAIMAEMKANFSRQIDSLNDKIEDLKKRVFETGGQRQGVNQMVTIIIAGLSALAAVASIIIVLSKAG
jgi:hypothetical protein